MRVLWWKSKTMTEKAFYHPLFHIAISRLFDQYTSTSPADKYQFGFKTGHSTALRTNTFKQIINQLME